MKKRLFRIASYLLILIMMMTNLPIAMAAPAEYRSLQISRENPHFAGFKAPTQITQKAPLYFSGGEEPTFHTNLEAAAQVIRDAMKARQDTFTVGYIVNENIPQDENAAREWLGEIAFDLLLEAAFDETDDPTEGDSLRLCYYGETPVQVNCWDLGNQTKLALTYDPTYFTDAAQEAELTAAVDELLEEFAFTDRTAEWEKADAIYQWLCDNVEYDYTSPGYLKHSAYAAMVNKTAVCQGYAVLFYRLAEEAGLDARAITGVATHNGEPHAWNIVQIDDYYYYLDSTWDAGYTPQNYGYYLRGENDFYGHTNDPRYETAEFHARYPLAEQKIAREDLELGDWKVRTVGKQATILKYLGNDAQVTVPATFDLADYNAGEGVLSVCSIESNAFSDGAPANTTIESITISEGIRRLGIYAISYCNNLKELHLPSTLELISYGFSSFTEAPVSCDNMEQVTIAAGNPYLKLENGVLYTADGTTALYCPPKNGLETLTLPNGVKVIGNEAFASHATLRQVTLPLSVEEIGYFAFQTASALEKITFNEGLDRIGQYAFGNCNHLKSVQLPASLRQILSGAFYGTPLQTITVSEQNDVFSMQNGMLIGNGIVYKFALSTQGEQISVPAGITEIDQGAFEGATFKGVALPSSLQEIGQTAFSGCKNLLHVTIPENVTLIGNMAFSGCDMLLSVVIPANATQFGNSLFHLGLPETYVTVFGEEGSKAQEYCEENNIEFKLLGTFPCGNGHNAQQVMDQEHCTALTDVWYFRCDVCGCRTRSFSKSYHSMQDEDITYEIESTTHVYDGTKFTPQVLWVKKGDTLLVENVDYWVEYGDNLVPGGINQLHLWGMGEFRGDQYIPLTIQRAPITNAVAVLDHYEFVYNGNPQQPWVQSLTLNGKTLTNGLDFVLDFENNIEIGTGYVIIRGNGNYKGELRVPFTISAHQHDWSRWFSFDSTQHYRFCTDSFCDEYGDKVYQPHCYDDIHDEICNDCEYTRTDAHSFTNRYDWNTNEHWRICDGCDKIEGTPTAHSGGKATCIAQAICSVCGQPYGDLSGCDWQRMMDDQYHWEKCSVCDDETAKVKHSGGTATCTAQANCEICGKAYGDLAEHQWYTAGDAVNHWEQCFFCPATQKVKAHSGPAPTICGTQAICVDCSMPFGTPAGHSGGVATCTTRAFCQYCSTPYGNLASHQWEQRSGTTHHWQGCKNCTATRSRTAHSGGTATCKEQAVCAVCQKAYGGLKNHQWSNACDTECNVCKGTRTVNHSFGTYVYNNDATSQKDGTMTRTCSVCQKTETVTAAGTKIENPFKDVQVKEYYAEPVLWAVGKGITNGTAKDTFSPNNECTRGQIVTFLWRAAGSPKPNNSKNPFKDVQKDAYYYDAVLWAVEKGITTGTSANTFSPDAACTRGQVVTFMWRAKGKPTATADNSFKDVQAGAYYYDAVLWAVKNGITNGTAPGAFSPDATCTRGQIVTFLYRSYK